MATVFDNHSTYLDSSEVPEFFDNMNTVFSGVGLEITQEDGLTRIFSILPEGPAEDSLQVLKDDIILKVAPDAEGPFVDIYNKDFKDVVSLLKGEENTTVRLEIQRVENNVTVNKTVTLIRRKIELKNKRAQLKLKNIHGKNLGIIKLPSFYRDGVEPTDHTATRTLKNF